MSKSLHTLFDKYLDQMQVKFEQNRIVRSIQHFELFDKIWLTTFEKKNVDAILEVRPFGV